MLFSYSFVLLFPITFCSSLDYLHLIQDYSRNVKDVHAITILSCPSRFNLQAWTTANATPDFLFQFMDITQGLQLPRVQSEANCHQVVVLDLGCSDYEQILMELSDQGQFNSLCRAFLLLNTRSDDEDENFYDNELKAVLSKTDFTFISNVAYGARSPIEGRQHSNDSFAPADQIFIYDVWNPGRQQGGGLKMDLMGVYRASAAGESGVMRFHELDDTITIRRRLNLSELHLQCAIVVTSPFNDTLESYITHNYDPYLDTVHRLNFRTIGLVQDYFKFQLRVKRTHTWGYVQNASSATTFDGMVGMVQRGEVDFGCSPAWFRGERLEVVDYGAQTWAIRPIFLFRHPNTRGLGRNVFLAPFEEPVWVVLLVSSVIIIMLMANGIQQDKAVLGRTTTKQPKGANPVVSFKGKLTLFFADVQHVFKSFVQSTRIYVSLVLQQGGWGW